MDTIGPLSRTVEDCALTLQAIAGPDSKDADTWDVSVPDYRAALDGNRAGLTTSFSLASFPALNICCGFTSENLPIGLQRSAPRSPA
jgi:Asp-tRNA(Asn)/Glu-tRNA(Gln) amidotransferase A subunit family amidase